MSRRGFNFPPGIWQARRDYGRNGSNINDSDRVNSMPPHSYSFEARRNYGRNRSDLNDSDRVNSMPSHSYSFEARRNYGRNRSNTNDSNRENSMPSNSRSIENPSRGRDPVPWQAPGEMMLARILDIGSPPEETPGIVRIIAHSRPRQLDPNTRSADRIDAPTPRFDGDSNLTSEEQNQAMDKLKKKIYDPTSKNLAKRISFYYRENNRGDYSEKSSKNSDEDEKRCAVCLEDFEPKEEVVMTPCNHMFHEDCIVPWVKSNGQCPVCRFAFFERTGRRASSNNTAANTIGNSIDDEELMSIIRAMEEAIMLRNLTGFWGA